MGMRSSISKLVQSAIKTTGDMAETVTYVSTQVTDYDVMFGNVTEAKTEYTFKAIVSAFGAAGTGKNDIVEGITSDLSVLYATADLAVTADTNDIVKLNGESHKIKQIVQDPVGASTRLIVARML
jgi:hypothetical protein